MGQGYTGSDSVRIDYLGGGGGGAGGVGRGDDGGLGMDTTPYFGDIYGDEGWFASGGGAASTYKSWTGSVSMGGGSPGVGSSDNATAAKRHTGGGGGGSFNGSSGEGGLGIVLITGPITGYSKSKSKITNVDFTFDGFNTVKVNPIGTNISQGFGYTIQRSINDALWSDNYSSFVTEITKIVISEPGFYRVRAQGTDGSATKWVELGHEITYNPTPYPIDTYAFHHGNFDTNDYGDADIESAALSGRFYANTLPGTYPGGAINSASATSDITTYTWTPNINLTVDVLMVAGGGSGGTGYVDSGAGGAGGVVFTENTTLSGQKTIVVGRGGASRTSNSGGEQGKSTSFTGLTTAVGGGFGGSLYNPKVGGSGGSGGGGAYGKVGGTGTSGQGYDGSDSVRIDYLGGGGGGAGGVGRGDDGGLGMDTTLYFGDIYGDEGWFASGGGGGSINKSWTGSASIGGGSPGVREDNATAAKRHTGGGGGGSYTGSSGEGGSGIVLITGSITGLITGHSKSKITNVDFTFDGFNTVIVNPIGTNISQGFGYTIQRSINDAIWSDNYSSFVTEITKIVISEPGFYRVRAQGTDGSATKWV